jgi:7-carboxy-7-deazaguanine synthase
MSEPHQPAVPAGEGASARLRISEIFHSLQGESSRVGLPTVFVRLTGCPLRCRWCDTEYAFSGGEVLTLDEVLARIAAFGCPTICVTGGEPLAQKACLPLLTSLCDNGYSVSLETSGALDISAVDARVARIVDIKAPGSAESAKNRWENLAHLSANDELKFVLASRDDYDWAVEACRQRRLLNGPAAILFSPVQGELAPADLAAWILEDRLPVRFQLQLHKILWADARGR